MQDRERIVADAEVWRQIMVALRPARLIKGPYYWRRRTRKKKVLTLGSTESHFIPAARACATRSRSTGSLC
jgi:hypothetical protein